MGAFFIATWWRQLIQGTNGYCERIYGYNNNSIEMRIMYIMLNRIGERASVQQRLAIVSVECALFTLR